MRTTEDEKQFVTLTKALGETFGVTLSSAQFMGYSMGLEGIAIEDVERAVGQAIRTLKFMPKPAELREMAGELTPATRAVMAWGVVKRAVHSVGAYGSPDFDDLVVNATIRNLGGWVDFCGRDAATFETFTRKDFERVYAQLADKAHLLGSDTTAHLKGIHDGPPKRIPTGLPPLGNAPKRLEAAQANGIGVRALGPQGGGR